MSEDFAPQMEGDIMAEENEPKTATQGEEKTQKDLQKPKRNPFDVKKFLLNIKAPKPIFMIVLFTIMIASYAGLIYLAVEQIRPDLIGKKDSGVIVDEGTVKPTPDPDLEKMSNEVENYIKKIEKANENSRIYEPPPVSLDINFQAD